MTIRNVAKDRVLAILQFAMASAAVAILALLIPVVYRSIAGAPLASVMNHPLPFLLGALALYALGHGLRIARLALLIGDWRMSLRRIAALHATTAALDLALPFKLADAYRILELARLTQRPVHSFLAVMYERVFDGVMLLALIVIAIVAGGEAADASIVPVALLVLLFLLGIAALIFVLPENLRRLSVAIIQRYRSPRTVNLLAAIHRTRVWLGEAPSLITGKVWSLFTISLMIWFCEAACFALALASSGTLLDSVARRLLAFLSDTIINPQMVLNGSSGNDMVGADVLVYLVVSRALLVAVGLPAAMLHFLWSRRR